MEERTTVLDHDNLEEFQDPANYDIEAGNGSHPSEAFYLALAQEFGGPVLDIACGTGLTAIPIARHGIAVTGIDIAPAMLEYARTKAGDLPIRWLEADARTFRTAEQFRFIYLTGNAFQQFLTRADQEALFATVRTHLCSTGVFAFETCNPSGTDLTAYTDEQSWFSYRNVHGELTTVTKTQCYDPITQIMHWVLYRRWQHDQQPRRTITRIACRFTYPQELQALLHYNGFDIIQQYGDWQRGPLGDRSPTIISVCRAH